MCIRFPGARRGGEKFVRRLPPDFSDYLTPPAEGAPKRTWRRAPGDKVDDALLFCAGDLDTLKDIGTRLHKALFKKPRKPGGDLTGEFLALREAAALRNECMEVRIDLTEAPELARVPWESLYLAADDLFLGIDATSNIVRILSPDRPGPLPAAVEPPLRMLVAVANPLGELQTGAELADIRRRLDGLLDENCARYELRTLPAATRSQFGSQIEDWKPHIIHFIGHGGFDDEQGLIYFHDERDPAKRDPVDSATLRDLVRNDRPWLVVLNSCLGGAAARADPFGGAAQNLLRINVPFVVAMQSPISDEAAVRFSQRFYASLIRGDPVAAAVTRGRNAIRSLGEECLRAELITPVLYSTGEASGIGMVQPKERPPQPSPAGFWARRVAPALPTLNNVAGIVSAIVAIAGIYLALQTGGERASKVSSSARQGAAAPAPIERPSDHSALTDSILEEPRLGAVRDTGASIPIGPRGAQYSGAAARPNRPLPRLVSAGRQQVALTRAAAPRPANAAPGSTLRHALPPAAGAAPIPRPGATAPTLFLPDGAPVRSVASARSSATTVAHGPTGAIGQGIGAPDYASFSGSATATAPASGTAASAGGVQEAAASRRSEQVASLVEQAFPSRRLRAYFDAPFGVPRRPVLRYGHEAALRALSPEMSRYQYGSYEGAPYEDAGPSRNVLTFASGSLAFSVNSERLLEHAALDARNGARVGLIAVVGSEPGAEWLARYRLAHALDYLLLRGAPPSLVRVAQARADAGALSVMRNLGVDGLIEIRRENYRTAQRRGGRMPVTVIASFARDSSEPLAEHLDAFHPLLKSEPGGELRLRLVGHVDAEEAASAGEKLARDRAAHMAARLGQLGVPAASFQVSAAPPPASSANPYLERRVDASLALKDAERMDVPPEPQALPPATGNMLDRLAGWLERHPTFGIHLSPAETVPGQDFAARAERARAALRERGIAEDRITAGPAASTPESEPAAPPAAGAAEPAGEPASAGIDILIVPLS